MAPRACLDKLPGCKGRIPTGSLPRLNWLSSIALTRPTHGPLRVAQELALQGINVIAGCVRGVATSTCSPNTTACCALRKLTGSRPLSSRRADPPARPSARVSRTPNWGSLHRGAGGGRHLLRRRTSRGGQGASSETVLDATAATPGDGSSTPASCRWPPVHVLNETYCVLRSPWGAGLYHPVGQRARVLRPPWPPSLRAVPCNWRIEHRPPGTQVASNGFIRLHRTAGWTLPYQGEDNLVWVGGADADRPGPAIWSLQHPAATSRQDDGRTDLYSMFQKGLKLMQKLKCALK